MNAAMATTGAMIQNPGVRPARGNESVVRVVDIARTIRGGQRSEKNGGKGGRRARALRGAKNAGAARACGRYDRTLVLRRGRPLRRRWEPEGRMVTVADGSTSPIRIAKRSGGRRVPVPAWHGRAVVIARGGRPLLELQQCLA